MISRSVKNILLLAFFSVPLLLTPVTVFSLPITSPGGDLPDLLNQLFDQDALLTTEKRARYSKILTSLKSNDFTKAIERAKELIGDNPADARAHLLLSLAWLGNGSEAELEVHIKELDRYNRDLADLIKFTSARFYTSKKRYYRALELTSNISNKNIRQKVLKLRADIYTFQGRNSHALDIYAQLYKQDNKTPDTLLNLSRLNMLKGELAVSRKYASELLVVKPKAVEAAIILGTTYLMEGDLKKAKKSFLVDSAKDPVLTMGLGHIAIVSSDFSSAREYYGDVLKQFPAMLEALQGLAITHIASGDTSSAINVLARAKVADQDDALTHLIDSAAFATRGELKQGLRSLAKTGALFFDMYQNEPEVLNTFSSEIKTSALNLALSNYLYRQGFFKLTKEITDKYRMSKPLTMLTNARAQSKMGDDKQALKLYQDIIDEYPDLLSPILEKADIYFHLGKLEETRLGYERAVAAKPGIPALHFRLGNLYNHLNLPKKAIGEYSKLLTNQRSKKNVLPLSSIASTLLEKQDKPSEALSYALKAQSLDPSNQAVNLLTGSIYFTLKEHKKAIKIYRNLSTNGGLKEPVDFYRLGTLLEIDGKRKDAVRAFEIALNSGKNFKAKGLTEKKYKELRGY